MKHIILAALLIAFCVPFAKGQDLEPLFRPNSFATPHYEKRFAPGQLLRVTLTRFTIPKGVKLTLPHFNEQQLYPGDQLQCYKDAAKAQKITPEITVFPPLLVGDGQTKEFSQGEGVGSALARDKNGKIIDDHQATFQIQRVRVTPNVRKDGIVTVKLEAVETHYTEDDRTHIRSHEKSVTTDRDSWNVLPGYAPGLFSGHQDRLGHGLLFLSVEHADAPPVKPAPGSKKSAANLKSLRDFSCGVSQWITVDVRLTDADVPADLVPAVTAAIMDPIGRQRRLLLLSLDAAKKGRTFVIAPGINGGCIPRSDMGIEPLDGDKLSSPGTSHGYFTVPVRNSLPPPAGTPDKRVKYRLNQALSIEGRMNPDKTVSLKIDLQERPLSLSGKDSFPIAGYAGMSISNSEVFHDGETKLLSKPSRADGVVHLIFATVTIHPPYT